MKKVKYEDEEESKHHACCGTKIDIRVIKVHTG